jgi:hypothetical protein
MRSIFEPTSRPLRQHRARHLHPFDVVEDEALPSGNIRPNPTDNATANSRRPFCLLDGWSYLIVGVALVLICIAFVIGAYFARKKDSTIQRARAPPYSHSFYERNGIGNQ